MTRRSPLRSRRVRQHRSRRSHHFRFIIGVLAAVLTVAPATAAALEPLDTFGGLGSGPGQLAPGAGGVALSPSGRIYVADTGNHRIQSFAPGGAPAGTFAGLGDGVARLNRPVGVAVDGTGRVYVSEADGDRLHRFAADGAPLGTSGGHGSGPGRLDDPRGVAIAGDGSILVVDGTNARVQVFAPTGGHLGGWGARGTGPGQFTDPDGIAVAPGGDVYVTDRAAGRVQRFSATGTFLGAFDGAGTTAGELVAPTGVTVDREGTVHVADAARALVVSFGPGGSVSALTAMPPFAAPAGLASDCRASVYVVDAGNGLVRRFGRAGATPPPCSAPTAAFSASPAPVEIGAQAYLDGSASGDDGRIVRMDWDLDGDGIFEQPDRGPTLTHVFARAGAMPVTLRVTDDDGEQGQVTVPVEVAPPVVEVKGVSTKVTPVIGVTLFAESVRGVVRFRRPGATRTETLKGRPLLPVGTRFDTTAGHVLLTLAVDGTGSVTQSGTFWDGIFTVLQGPDAPLTELLLVDPGAATGDAARRATAAAKRRRSRLWGDAKGSFKTTGRNAAATVRGTRWLTQDDDDGTTVAVSTGVVSVRDDVAGKTVQVRAGRRYVARDACASERSFRIRLRVPVGVQVRTAIVRLGDRPIAVRQRGGRLTALIDLRGRPRTTARVRITLVTTTGVRLAGVRTYRTCDRKRSGGAAPRI